MFPSNKYVASTLQAQPGSIKSADNTKTGYISLSRKVIGIQWP